MNSKIEQYILSQIDKEDEVLHEIDRQTNLQTLYPSMLSGHLQGKFLELISKMLQPSRILEIGTFTGYSAICLAKGLIENGMLHTIEINDEMQNFLHTYFAKAGLANKIQLHIGDANQIIPTLNETFDLVFIDGEKTQYISYYNLILPKLRSGGIILADNVLWYNKVLEKPENADAQTRGILNFNEFVKNDNRVEKVILPIRDGISLIRKK